MCVRIAAFETDRDSMSAVAVSKWTLGSPALFALGSAANYGLIVQANERAHPVVGFFRIDHPTAQVIRDRAARFIVASRSHVQKAVVGVDVAYGMDAISRTFRAKTAVDGLVFNFIAF